MFVQVIQGPVSDAGQMRSRLERWADELAPGSIGWLGTILGSFLGAAFIVLTPIFLNQLPSWLGIPISTAMISHIEFMLFGVMIVFFLIVEPHGLARLWAIAKEKLRLWPFPY